MSACEAVVTMNQDCAAASMVLVILDRTAQLASDLRTAAGAVTKLGGAHAPRVDEVRDSELENFHDRFTQHEMRAICFGL
jgi:hypothetical protein